MVDRADVSSVLSDIRALREQMQEQQRIQQQPEIQQPDRVRETRETEGPTFGETLQGAVDRVNDLQQTAGELQTAYEQGDPNVDITRVMVAGQKSEVAFQSMVQVRNRVVQAYEEIMNMPI